MPHRHRGCLLLVRLLSALLFAWGLRGGSVVRAADGEMDRAYQKEIEVWRASREARLKSDGGWLTVAGLFWLEEGANPFGSDAGATVVLPAHVAPPRAGVFHLKDGKVTVKVDPAVKVTLGGNPPGTAPLRPDTIGEPDLLVLGPLTMNVVERGGRVGIRLKDMTSKARRDFKGLRWYPVRPAYRVTARLVPHPAPVKIPVPNILGYVEELPSPGTVEFELAGKKMRLAPVWESPGATELFFIFRDRTNGKGTYPAGRFFYATAAKDGTIVIDFNKAYSPPCAFTAYATCPLPPRQNYLPVAIEAGELYESKKGLP